MTYFILGMLIGTAVGICISAILRSAGGDYDDN